MKDKRIPWRLETRMKIAIASTELKEDRDSVLKCAYKNDATLSAFINKYADQLESEGVEVYERIDNLIATEKGWFIAIPDTTKVDVEES